MEYEEAVKHITMTPKEKKQLTCLQALFCHSRLENNHDLFVKSPILPSLLELIGTSSEGSGGGKGGGGSATATAAASSSSSSSDCDGTRILVAQIIGNVACRPEAIPTLVLSGWIGVLVKWRQSDQSSFRLQLAAARALVNIHGSFFLSQLGNVFQGRTSIRRHFDDKKSPRVPCLVDGVYAYDPLHSFFTGDFEADVVFVHGLLGELRYQRRLEHLR